ncbi:MAG: DUF2807 domain-containing protein [Bacteroidota bacterium]|nr:DUF2807 domain-containing protein [Bacteroidota bacterium]
MDCFKSTGTEITEVRYPGMFRNIEVRDNIEVNIRQGNEYRVDVIAGKNMVKNVTTVVTDTTLKIGNSATCNFVRGYKRKIVVNITMPYVSKIFNYGVNSIILDAGFNQDSTLYVRNENTGDTYINGKFKLVNTSSHGAGDMYLSGSSKILLVYSNGTNFTFAEKFTVTDQIFISNYSIGDAYLNLQGVTDFGYYIWKQGNIFYYGNPQSINNLGAGKADGKGQLIKKD